MPVAALLCRPVNEKALLVLAAEQKDDQKDMYHTLDDDDFIDRIRQLRPQRELLSLDQIDPTAAWLSTNARCAALRVFHPIPELARNNVQEVMQKAMEPEAVASALVTRDSYSAPGQIEPFLRSSDLPEYFILGRAPIARHAPVTGRRAC